MTIFYSFLFLFLSDREFHWLFGSSSLRSLRIVWRARVLSLSWIFLFSRPICSKFLGRSCHVRWSQLHDYHIFIESAWTLPRCWDCVFGSPSIVSMPILFFIFRLSEGIRDGWPFCACLQAEAEGEWSLWLWLCDRVGSHLPISW
jgi:hypothetical protein